MQHDEWAAKARELRAYMQTCLQPDHSSCEVCSTRLAATLRAIDAAAERRGLERAAKWHDEVVAWAEAMLAKARGPDQEDKWKAMMREHKGMAADIRALAQPVGQ